MADFFGGSGNDFLDGTNADDFIQGFAGIDNLSRSEERRVWKECRSRCSPYN